MGASKQGATCMAFDKRGVSTILMALVVFYAALVGVSGDDAQTNVRGSALRLGFDVKLAQRLLDHIDDYSPKEKSAFEAGYRAAMQDVVVMVGMSLSVGVFLVVCFSRTLYHRLRATVRPWA